MRTGQARHSTHSRNTPKQQPNSIRSSPTPRSSLLQQFHTCAHGCWRFRTTAVAVAEKQKAGAFVSADLIFDAADVDGSGFIEVEDLKKVLNEMKQETPTDMDALIKAVDADGETARSAAMSCVMRSTDRVRDELPPETPVLDSEIAFLIVTVARVGFRLKDSSQHEQPAPMLGC